MPESENKKARESSLAFYLIEHFEFVDGSGIVFEARGIVHSSAIVLSCEEFVFVDLGGKVSLFDWFCRDAGSNAYESGDNFLMKDVSAVRGFAAPSVETLWLFDSHIENSVAFL